MRERLKTTSKQLEEVEAEWISCEERLKVALRQLAEAKDGKDDLKKRLKAAEEHFAEIKETEDEEEWTITQFKDSLSEEIRDYHEANFPEERCKVFYRTVAETQNLIEAEGWQLEPRFREKKLPFLVNG